MTIVIDPNFSVYQLVTRIKQQSTVLSHRATMSRVSYEIESATIVDHAKTRVFAGFQRQSKFLPQVERYRKLAAQSESVYVFGIPDVTPPPIPNVTYVPLQATDHLAREWFLISHGLDYHSALATEELTRIDDPDDDRVFQGLWTFDLDMVKILEEWLTSVVDAAPLYYAEDAYQVDRQFQIMGSSMHRLISSTSRRQTDTQEIVRNEIRTLVKDGLHPTLPDESPATYERDAIILFTDLRDFTTISESMSPRQLVHEVINPYLKTVTQAVNQQGGTIDKFIGDGVLAIFGLEANLHTAADHALQASQQILEEISQNRPYAVGVGLAYGRVMVGEIGSREYAEKTVIGDAVNVASRLSQLGDNEIWVSYTLRDLLENPQRLEPNGEIYLKGKSDPHRVYRITANSMMSGNLP